ncbi:zinc finger protein interacting with ribonucleoprotein K [Bicyclus anynana]|uniref:Zinc finger protein interacting with ribonucleoprotein K n=1 Tax=Bicyclus anynana TaxID=110368 RepID=A0ABM3M5R6_BICAN|nr:zinc finger protein interacting with ribonucleoprotein K [Bicyclus anynana]
MKLKDICCACLSVERSLTPLHCVRDGINLFSLLSQDLKDFKTATDKKHYHVCWECRALLRRLYSFRQQAAVARRQLEDILNDSTDVDSNKECLSKLSYSYKRSFDRELVYTYSDVLNHTIDNEVDIPKCHEISIIGDIKVESDESNPFSDLNLTDIDIENDVKLEHGHATKQEVANQNGVDDDNYFTIHITKDEIEENKPRRRVLEKKSNVTAKRKCVKNKKSNLKTVKKDLEDENTEDTKQEIPTVPKTRRHRKVQNSPKKDSTYPCAECGQIFTTYTRRYEHIMKYHKEGYQCATCGKKFHIKKSFLRHERVHIAKTLPRQKCSICDVMVRCDLVQEHAARHASTDRGTYRCVPCQKTFANKNSYRKHMTEAKAHIVPDKDNKFSCETCHKSFPTLMLYNCHMRYTKRHAVRAAVYRYKCSMCDKSYRSPAALRDHVNYVHMGKTQHKCAECDKALASPQCVARHMKLFHGGYKYPKNKLCDTCGKAFSSKKDLREHESVHTGERPLKCDICGDSFRQSGALYTHKRRVHKMAAKRSVQLETAPDEAVERLVRSCELDEDELVIHRVKHD